MNPDNFIDIWTTLEPLMIPGLDPNTKLDMQMARAMDLFALQV